MTVKITLLRGTKYLVRYRVKGFRNNKYFVGTFLNETPDGRCIFDMRPEAGTTTMPRNRIAGISVTTLKHGSFPR